MNFELANWYLAHLEAKKLDLGKAARALLDAAVDIDLDKYDRFKIGPALDVSRATVHVQRMLSDVAGSPGV